MRIRQLDIEHFGLFSNRRVEFSDAAVQVIYGPNEAGKSTLLQSIRETLFGFSVRNPYAFEEHSGEMAAVATIELSDGAQYRFRRRKGRAKEVVGENLDTGEKVDKVSLSRLLGGASAELFEHIFGFSLAELSSGEKSLQHAKLSEALYGGALGGLAGIQKILQDLQRDQEQLFSPAATKKPVNLHLGQLRQQGKNLRAAETRPRDYEALARTVDELERRVKELRRERDDLQRKQSRCADLVKASGLWQRQNQLTQEMAALEIPQAFPPDGDQQYRDKQQSRDLIAQELAEFVQEKDEVQGRLESLSPSSNLIAHQAEIQRLAQQLDKIRGFRRDVRLREQESLTVKDNVAGMLRELDPAWTLDDLARFRTSLARRANLESMRRELDEIESRSLELNSRRPALEADMASISAALEGLKNEQIAESLMDLVEGAGSYQAQREKHEQCRKQLGEWTTQIQAVELRLNAPFGHRLEEIVALPVPMSVAVTEMRHRWQSVEQQLERCRLSLQQVDVDIQDRNEALEALQAEDDVPDRGQLTSARKRRDHGWELTRRLYVDGEEVSQEEIETWLTSPAESLPDAFPASVQQADQIADERQKHAETVARQDQLVDQIKALERRRSREFAKFNEATDLHQDVQSEWNLLWEPSGLTPQLPEIMLDWLRLHEELVELSTQRRLLQEQADDTQRAIEQFEQRLSEALGRQGTCSADCLPEAQRIVKRAREAAAERRTYDTQLPRKQHELATLDADSKVLQQRRTDWHDRWQPLLAELGFPTSWDVYTATKVLNGISDARQEHDKAISLDQRVADMQSGIEQFECDVNLLAEQLAPDLLELPAEKAVEELDRLLDQAKQDERDQTTLSQQLARLKVHCESKQAQLVQANEALRKLLDSAGAADDSELFRIAQDVQSWHQLRDEKEGISSQLRAIQGNEDMDSLQAELAEADAAELESRQRLLKSDLIGVDARFNDALQEKGVAAEKLRELDGASRAAEIAQQIESTRSQFVDSVDAWAPLVIARSFMQRALERFEREHQPQMMLDVGQFLSRMTLGRYTEITRRLDEQGTLQVRQADGKVKEPGQLSTGTREQLYLAIRLAYVKHYCRDSEPLPVVMDDVLVNFDDQRSAATLDALVELGQSVQLLLLTCHQGTLELIQSRLPDARSIMLD